MQRDNGRESGLRVSGQVFEVSLEEYVDKRKEERADQHRQDHVPGEADDADSHRGSAGGGMFDIQDHHYEHCQAYGDGVPEHLGSDVAYEEWFRHSRDGQSAEQAGEMAADYGPCACGDVVGHREDNEGGGADGGYEDGFFVDAEGHQYEKDNKGSEQALEDIMFPVAFEFAEALFQ